MDHWRWHYNASGKFSVKSAYHVLVEDPGYQATNDILTAPPDKTFWKKLWKLRIPQRAKHSAWRLITDTLPTTSILRQKRVMVPITCLFCEEEDGSASHLFFDCACAKEVWEAVGWNDRVQAARRNRGSTWFKNLIFSNEPESAEVVVMIFDALWRRRNMKLFQGKDQNSAVLAGSTIANLRSFKDANGWPERMSAGLHVHSLLKPSDEGWKLYFDAGLTSDSAAIGAVLFDGSGRLVRAISKRILGVTDTLLAEDTALYEALLMTEELGAANVSVIGDALGLIQMIREEADPAIVVSNLIIGIQDKLAECGFDRPFWTPRDKNHCAHSLASYAKTSLEDTTVWDSPPSFFLSTDTGRFPVT